MRLFLCDDNPQYRELARLVLQRAGHEIVGEASDGGEAIERAPQCAPEVVLLDLNMPNVNGLDALPRLRDALGPKTKILILTTGQAPWERRLSLDAGADGFIVKPERVLSLDDDLRAALKQRSAETRLAHQREDGVAHNLRRCLLADMAVCPGGSDGLSQLVVGQA